MTTTQTVLTGLAPDGGLYIPESIPQLPENWRTEWANYSFVDLSVAVATPKGLVTPVVRNAEALGFVAIEREIAALGKKARDNKLTLEDMAGGTFTMCACTPSCPFAR